MIGPSELWKLETSTEIKAGMSGMNSCSGEKVTPLNVYLHDGTHYSI